MPDWARSTFGDFLDHTQMLGEVLELTISGIGMITATPQAVRALHYVSDSSESALPADVKSKIAAADERARLAKREVDSDFNIIHSQAVVTVWGALEDVVKTLVARWLINLPQTRLEPPWATFRVRVGEYEQLDEEAKAHYLVSLIEQNTAAQLKQGVARFECLLDAIGLSGPLDDRIRDSIFEMQQVRNVIAHRRGIADGRFCRSCPHFQLASSQRLMVSHKMWHSYAEATHSYVLEIIYRTGEKFGDSGIRERSRRATPPEGAQALW